MPKQVECDHCDTTVRGIHDDDLVTKHEDHMKDAHPDKEPKGREEVLAAATKAD